MSTEFSRTYRCSIKGLCGCSLMVEPQPSKLTTWVRFPSSAPFVKIVGTTDVEIKLNSKELSFFVFKKG